MNKHLYLVMRNSGSLGILYEYYKDHYDNSRHNRFIGYQEFFDGIQRWNAMGIPTMMDTAISYFDNKFGVAKLFNKEGNLIRLT